MTRFDGILFDNDGTLVDTHDLILSSFRYSTSTVLGKTIPDEVLMRKVGQPLATQMWDFTDELEVRDELLRVYRKHNEAVHDEMISVFPGVAEGLSRLAEAGVKMGVVTSKMHRLAWHGLEHCGLSRYFACCIGADDCEQHKPAPGPIEAGARALGLAPGTCLYVGDSPFDIQAGRAAGCATAAVLWGMFPSEDLLAENPTATFEDFALLTDWALQ